MNDLTKMNPEHLKVLQSLNEIEYDEPLYYHFASIMGDTRFDRAKVRRIVRHLARKGLAKYAKGLWTDEGTPAGSGYAITDEGKKLLERSE